LASKQASSSIKSAGRLDGAWRNSGWITNAIGVPKADLIDNWQ